MVALEVLARPATALAAPASVATAVRLQEVPRPLVMVVMPEMAAQAPPRAVAMHGVATVATL